MRFSSYEEARSVYSEASCVEGEVRSCTPDQRRGWGPILALGVIVPGFQASGALGGALGASGCFDSGLQVRGSPNLGALILGVMVVPFAQVVYRHHMESARSGASSPQLEWDFRKGRGIHTSSFIRSGQG